MCNTEKNIKYSFNQLLWIMDFEFTDEEESSKTTKSVNVQYLGIAMASLAAVMSNTIHLRSFIHRFRSDGEGWILEL